MAKRRSGGTMLAAARTGRRRHIGRALREEVEAAAMVGGEGDPDNN